MFKYCLPQTGEFWGTGKRWWYKQL